MEMPEGWKYLEEELRKKQLKCFRPEDQDDRNGGWCTPVGCVCYVQEEYSLILLKEMAEALEQEILHLENEGYGHDANAHARRTLKKFKEWK